MISSPQLYRKTQQEIHQQEIHMIPYIKKTLGALVLLVGTAMSTNSLAQEYSPFNRLGTNLIVGGTETRPIWMRLLQQAISSKRPMSPVHGFTGCLPDGKTPALPCRFGSGPANRLLSGTSLKSPRNARFIPWSSQRTVVIWR